MIRKGFILGILAVIFISVGAIVNRIDPGESRMQSQKNKLEAYIKKNQKEISNIVSGEQEVIESIHLHMTGNRLESIKDLNQRSFTLFLYQGDSLLGWTNTTSPLIDSLPEYDGAGIVDRVIYDKDNASLVTVYPLKAQGGEWKVISILPLTAHGFFVRDEGETTIKSKDGVQISQFRSAYPVTSLYAQQPVAYLHPAGGGGSQKPKLFVLALYIAGLFCLLLFLYGLSNIISRHKHVLWGVAFMFASTILVWGIYHGLGTGEMIQWLLTGKAPVEKSGLPDLLINVTLFFWLLAFTYKTFRQFSFSHLSVVTRIMLGAMNHFGILLGMVMLGGISKSLVVDSAISFNFDNVLNIDTVGIVALFSITSFLLAFFIVSHRMTLIVQKLKLTIYQRLFSISLAFLLITPLFLSAQLDFSIAIFFLVAIIYLLLFDIFVEEAQPSLRWVLVWLILFSGFSSIILFKYSKDAELITRHNVAQAILQPVDSALIDNISAETLALQSDDEMQINLRYCLDLDSNCALVKTQIINKLHQNNYISHYYDLSTNEVNHTAELINEAEKSVWKLSESLTIDYYIFPEDRGFFQVQWMFKDADTENAHSISIAFREKKLNHQPHSRRSQGHLHFKNLEDLSHYDFALYRNTTLIMNAGYIYERILPSSFQLQGEGSKELVIDDRSELIVRSNGDTVVIGQALTGILKPISLFSYIFALLVCALLLLGLINVYYPLLPESLKYSISKKPTLRNKIQLSVLTLIIFSFFVVGLATVYYFSNSTAAYNLERLNNKAISIQYDAELKLKDFDLNQYDDKLQREMVSLSNIHQTDIHMYGRDGRLVHSSNPEFFSTKRMSTLINPIAYKQLFHKGNFIFINEEERQGDALYQAAFVPIYQDYDKPQAIISLSYTSPTDKDESIIGSFMSTLLNVYVLLLMIAGLIAVFVSNSITQPLTTLSEKIKSFKLGKNNEPIQWDNNDELGALISEYNAMIEKLERSAEILAQNEREVAWREMAKQVAHEIKNPLTPMKLSIQHLMYKIPNLPKDEAIVLIDRVSETLIEQIDNLTKIATEFSNFSKLPRPNNEPIILNDLVASVHDLFRKREDISFNLYVPIDEIYVMADRSHILRILNNLIKNAVQAIPAIKKGKIDIKLYTLSGMAIIQVKDNGEGIPEDMQDKVFYPNFTTKSSGTGLGLAICKDMAEAYGGKIYFETEEGEGTSFYLELPLMKEDKI